MNDFILFYILRKVVTIVFGTALVISGIAGLILPILPGIILIFAGLALLARHSERVRNLRFVKRFVTKEA
ncbi:hypothetical protein HOF40_02325 [Candidatus Parcubacteria bacterium]|jgi:uncharacterized protein YqgC (DUF456 family)|nr:hypothetical protein [Candidatus Parcubacteria bacterium]MBT3948901.1 hypothetical protein [Candidatus Parcubacteria bacterium]